MAGGVPAVDLTEDLVQLRRMGVRMGLAAVPPAPLAHHTRGPFPHGGVAQRAVPGKEQGQPVGVHTSSFWATVQWAL